VLLAFIGAIGGAAGWNLLRDPGAASLPEILGGTPEEPSEGAGKRLSGPEKVKVPGVEGSSEPAARERIADAGFDTEVKPRKSPQEDDGKVLQRSVPGGRKAEEDSKVLLTVGEAPEVAKVPNLVGLSYPEAENKLEEAGFLLGGVHEAPSDAVPAGVIMKQDTPASTTQEVGSYVYLTTSLGPSETANTVGAGQEFNVTGSQLNTSSAAASSEEAVVAAAVRGHYQAIGAGNFEEAYSYFGPTFRSQHDAASWIAGEQSYEIQDSTIHSLTVDEVSATTATVTVDVSFVDNTGTPRFVIVWSLVKEGGAWKLDSQISAQRVAVPQPDSSPAPAATPTASPSASPSASPMPLDHAGVSPVREENAPPSHLVNGNQSGVYQGVDSLLRRDHP
jgi:hypothetical protein